MLLLASDVQSDMAEFRHTAWNVFPVRIQHRSAEPAG